MPQLEFAAYTESEKDTFFVEVILPLALNDTFTYRVPRVLESVIAIGKRVIVSFGKRHIYTGIIAQIHNNPPKEYTVKYIHEVIDYEQVTVSNQQIEFWKWIASYYMCSLGEVMDAALPANLKLKSETIVNLHPSFKNDESIKLNNNEKLIVDALALENELSLTDIAKILGIKNVMPVINSLYKKGILLIKEATANKYKPKIKKVIKLHSDYENEEMLAATFDVLVNDKRTVAQSELLLCYLKLSKKLKIVDKNYLLNEYSGSASTLKSLLNKKILIEEEIEVDRLFSPDVQIKEVLLSGVQNKALDDLKYKFKEHQVCLLMGETGSGKTHIYVELIKEQLELGKKALYLLPEIALTKQLISRLKFSFGNKIGIYHSKMGDNERVEMWYKVQSGQYDVVLGVRSSIFLPFSNLGIIIVDEEHEPSYKQQDPSPRYHARDASIYMALSMGAKVLLGTATPSFESYYNAQQNKYGLVYLNQRHGNVKPPIIELVDMKDFKSISPKMSHISFVLKDRINESLAKAEQIILFMNRRGFAPVIECKSCAWIPSCKNCDISLTYHKYNHSLSCHYCGYSIATPSKCPTCGSVELGMKGLGTERLEDDLELLFPNKEITRMDLDTTRKKNSIEDIFQDMEAGKTDILVGTQMVTKGLDFEKVRLVGIISADSLMQYPDFRALERSFQMMYQVAGRTGRREKQGKVVIQTFNPDHNIFDLLIKYNYKSFYFSEMSQRQMFKYPPYTRLIKMIFRHKENDKVEAAAKLAHQYLYNSLNDKMLGPEAPPVARLRNKYYQQMLFKLPNNAAYLKKVKSFLLDAKTFIHKSSGMAQVEIYFDVDTY